MEVSGTFVHQTHTVLHLKGKFTKFRNWFVLNRKKNPSNQRDWCVCVGGGECECTTAAIWNPSLVDFTGSWSFFKLASLSPTALRKHRPVNTNFFLFPWSYKEKGFLEVEVYLVELQIKWSVSLGNSIHNSYPDPCENLSEWRHTKPRLGKGTGDLVSNLLSFYWNKVLRGSAEMGTGVYMSVLI